MQFRIIMYSFMAGLMTGFIFDIYRIIRGRKVIKYIVFIEDLLFWILCSLVVFVFLLYTQFAVLSVYVYIYLILGIIFYLWFFSNFFFKIEKKAIEFLWKFFRVLIKFLIYPFKIIFYRQKNCD
ncbi:spore cortex biosynthesis protein YabQ [Alloiococcus sp. CFN-8]|uniref:spore cortex biosynthesis protein YabQ n=1 Tax=Alloiococcus sp. CFN-8 TaxID=3416081 RepID=UPI003CEB9CEE